LSRLAEKKKSGKRQINGAIPGELDHKEYRIVQDNGSILLMDAQNIKLLGNQK